MNKMFTAVSRDAARRAGKLSLDDPLAKFLPAGAMTPDVLTKVRIKHLLSHTSGLGSYFTDEWDGSRARSSARVDDLMPLVKDETLQFEPGTRWSYSNTGMLVLGKVIEAASGQDYFDYVREHIYKPAGMTNTDAYELDRVNQNLAVGYEPERGRRTASSYRNNIFLHVIRGGPAGGGYSTVGGSDAVRRGAEGGQAGERGERAAAHDAQARAQLAGVRLRLRRRRGRARSSGTAAAFRASTRSSTSTSARTYTLAVMSNYGGGAQPVIEKARVADAGGAGADGVAVEAGGPATATLHIFRVEETSVAHAE